MICPICGANDLLARKGLDEDPDASRKSNEKTVPASIHKRELDPKVGTDHCPVCRFETVPTWKYCPECGLRFSTLARPDDG